MKPIRRTMAGLVAAAALAAGTPAICADAAPNAHSEQLARRLFTEMNMSQLTDNMMKTLAPTVLAEARKNNPGLTDEQTKAISEAMVESTGDLMAKLTDRMIPLYASTFSEKELEDLVAFYDGPSGRAMLAKMPVLMAKMGPLMTELMPQMRTDMMQRICAKTDCSKLKGPPKSGS